MISLEKKQKKPLQDSDGIFKYDCAIKGSLQNKCKFNITIMVSAQQTPTIHSLSYAFTGIWSASLLSLQFTAKCTHSVTIQWNGCS